MRVHASELILYSVVLCSGATAGGWAITSKLAGDSAAYAFLSVGFWFMIAIHVSQLSLLLLAKSLLFWQIFFRVMCGMSLSWFFLSLALPILWIPEVDESAKMLMSGCAILLLVCNFAYALRHFSQAWSASGQATFEKHYCIRTNAVDWDRVMKQVRLRARPYLPGMPEKLSTPIFAISVLFMIAGLNFRSAFPVFSALAWGIPATFGLSLWMQITGFGVAQLLKIRELERKLGRPERIAICKDV